MLNYYSLFFFSKFLIFFLSCSVKILVIKTSSLTKNTKVSLNYYIKEFLLGYSAPFFRVGFFFKFLVRYFFFFFFFKQFDQFSNWLSWFYTSLNRAKQSTTLKILNCIFSFSREFLIRLGFFNGFCFVSRGKLSWKALSRKKKILSTGGSYSNSNQKNKAVNSVVRLRTITGVIGLNFSIFFKMFYFYIPTSNSTFYKK